jgi:hypothetical protein
MRRLLTLSTPFWCALLFFPGASWAVVRPSKADTPSLLGDRMLERRSAALPAGRAQAFAFRTGPSGTAGRIHVYMDAHATAKRLLVGLYSDAGGHPGSLLTTGSIFYPRRGAWNSVPVVATSLVPGATYWLAVLGSGGALRYRFRSHGHCKSETRAGSSRGALTSRWRTGRVHRKCPISAYLTGTRLSFSVGPLVPSDPASGPGPGAPSPAISHQVGSQGGESAAPSPRSEPPPSELLPPPPAPPSNTAPPVVTGSAEEGRVLSGSTGAWTGSPGSYAYQWQDCNASGQACMSIGGATSAQRTLSGGDVGHTVRVIVTAKNPGGSGVGASAPTAVVQGKPVSCTTNVSSSMSGSAIAATIVAANDGDTICMSEGSYPQIVVNGATHQGYVTVRPAPGATVTVDGMEVANSSFLRFEGLRMTEGFNMRDSSSGASHDYEFVEDRFEEPLYGIVLYGGSSPVKKVLIEGNYMRRVHLEKPEVEGKCSAGYAQGQDVTMYYAEGVRIAHNTFKEAAWHYIQGGSEGPEGVDVEHNLFEGHIMMNCSHLNIWQIWSGGENDTFKDNIALGENGQQAATDGVIFENGAGSVECNVKMKNSVIENNLFVNAATSYELQIYTTEGATIKNNTVVGSEYGTALLTEHCGAGSNYTMTHNIDVEDKGTGNDFNFGACTGTCTFDYNVSQDKSASSAHSVTEWAPKWTATVWSPATEPSRPTGFYVPTGLSVEAGYQGNIGP